jgi:cystathionine beta-lyase family protein involved in aluminum resistance
VAAFGKPYDTLIGIIDGESGYGSLKELGIAYRQVEPTADGEPDYDEIRNAAKTADAILVQRSRGYSKRKPLSLPEIGRICEIAKHVNPKAVIIVDNCYGEFTATSEPTSVGAHLIAGSLIKNPGGGIAPAGGYVAGMAELVEKAASRLTAPGLGSHCGPTLGMNRLIAQGLYFAPMITCEAMCSAAFASCFLTRLGFKVDPGPNETRGDSVVRVELGSKDKLLSFMKAVQSSSPVDSKATPIPGFLPGYEDDVVMAAGAFIQGSSIELSADAPMRPPFTAYMQGGLSRHQMEATLMAFADVVRGRGQSE